MRVLALSDKVVRFIYSPQLRQRFEGVDLAIGCGDLPYYYLEYVLDMLDIPVFYVRGNHDVKVEYSTGINRTRPDGASDLHLRHVQHRGILLAGVEGSLRYRPGPYQYSQSEMWRNVFHLVPGLLRNRMKYGRFLDVFVTHSPPYGMHDQDDLPHQGIKAFRWLVDSFQPGYYFHGHVHVIGPSEDVIGRIRQTVVINAFGFQEQELVLPPAI